MADLRRYQLANVALFAVALSHALLTWPRRATVALFVGGAGIAFALEAVGVAVGLLRHRFRPQVASVPVTIILAWPAVIYLAYRVARLVTPAAVPAAGLAAALAAAGDLLVEARMVDAGAWAYPETAVSAPRIRGAPWWNAVAWLAIGFATALLPAAVG